jgi:uncharacterized protein (DUF58 family)
VDDLTIEYSWNRVEFQQAMRRSTRITIGEFLFFLVVLVLSFLISGAVFILLFVVLLWAAMCYVIRPILLWKRRPGIKETRRVTFTDEGITTATESSSSFVPWTRFARSKESVDYYYVTPRNSGLATPLRKDFFPSPHDEVRFRSLLRTNTKASLLPNSVDGVA